MSPPIRTGDVFPRNHRRSRRHARRPAPGYDENDEVLERIYIGRRFRNGTERLEKLFALRTEMTAAAPKDKNGEEGRMPQARRLPLDR